MKEEDFSNDGPELIVLSSDEEEGQFRPPPKREESYGWSREEDLALLRILPHVPAFLDSTCRCWHNLFWRNAHHINWVVRKRGIPATIAHLKVLLRKQHYKKFKTRVSESLYLYLKYQRWYLLTDPTRL